jgi:hypothetical protein
LIDRQLFSTETRSREAVPNLRFWDCESYVVSRTALPSDVLALQFKYYHNEKSLWTVDYIRSLDPEVIPYYDDSEDQTVQPGDVLNPNRGYKDERSLDYSVYDDHPIDYANCGDVGLPMKDMYVVRFIWMSRTF